MARKARLGWKEPAATPALPARRVPWAIAARAGQRGTVARAASVAACWWAQWALKAREGQWGLQGLQVGCAACVGACLPEPASALASFRGCCRRPNHLPAGE